VSAIVGKNSWQVSPPRPPARLNMRSQLGSRERGNMDDLSSKLFRCGICHFAFYQLRARAEAQARNVGLRREAVRKPIRIALRQTNGRFVLPII
jgi:hypothetical protein